MSKILYFKHRDALYQVNEEGYIKSEKSKNFSKNWIFLGVSKHHMNNHVTIPFKKCWENPDLMMNGYVWDVDHGTTRMWSGQYNGKIPRITSVMIRDE